MNPSDILKYAHSHVIDSITGIEEPDWETPGVVGFWSVKDLIAHLASFEWVLVEVLNSFLGGGETPTLDELLKGGQYFNDSQVPMRAEMTPGEVWEEYVEAQRQVMERLDDIPPASWRQVGALPWYGAEYDLEDLVVYQYYGHKREHSGQINLYRDRLREMGRLVEEAEIGHG